MKSKTLSTWQVALQSLRFFKRSHAAVSVGIAAATAVIVGALVVGDSVRASLRGLVLDRLGNIECLLQAQTFFQPQALPATVGGGADTQTVVVPILLLQSSTIENRSDGQLRRSSKVQVLGTAEDFWGNIRNASSGQSPLPAALQEDEVAINESLARELNVSLGDELTLRLSDDSGVPADNPLGRRDDTTTSLPRQKLVAILPDDGVGSVSFESAQSVPRNVFCCLASLQDLLQVGSQVNAALLLNSRPNSSASLAESLDWCVRLNAEVRPTIEDYGLQFERIQREFPSAGDAVPSTDKGSDGKANEPTTIYDYYQITSRELIIDDPTADLIANQTLSATRLLTYLANSIARVTPVPFALSSEGGVGMGLGDMPDIGSRSRPVQLESREVPYSIVVGVDHSDELALEHFNELVVEDLRMPYCWITSWLADQINAAPGDWIQVKFYEPETIDGNERETDIRFIVTGIVPLTEPVQGFTRNRPAKFELPPTVFNDPNLTPHVPGLTDKESISNWDAPFPLNTDMILSEDDAYYSNHRLTPKIFLPYRFAASPQLFGSRFGTTTAVRFPAAQVADEAVLRSQIEEDLLDARQRKGLMFLPVRANLLNSASGTTPFDMLFLSLSFFVIVAALLLVALLFKLGIGQRASQLGVLAAQGFSAGRIRSLLIQELSIVSCLGAGLGILLGLAYARGMIAALESWWIGAISSPFLRFSFSWQSLLIGALAGVSMSLATIYWSIRNMSLQPPLDLLRGHVSQSTPVKSRQKNRVMLTIAGFICMAALGLILAGLGQSGMARAGIFFGSGMLLLIAALLAVRQMLILGAQFGKSQLRRNNLFTLAWRAICRNPLRSSLALGLLSVASFLIASMSVFHVSSNPRGYGGFNLLAESSTPIYRNLGSSQVRFDVLGNEAEKLRNTTIVSMRVKPGTDASCNNMFQVAQPTVLAIPSRLSELHDFSVDAVRFDWAATDNPTNPWLALKTVALGTEVNPIPVILDQNTAAWSLKQGGSLGALVQIDFGQQSVFFRTVGLLSNSVLQGKLLIGEDNFRHLFPEISGYGFFMIRSADEQHPATVAETLEAGWSDQGLDVTSSREVLDRLLAVQNTYISAFQSLGALGLLLGTFGLVSVQLRSVIERRKELALMQAVGFSKPRLTRMLTLETAILLGGGLLIGIAAAAIALVPYILENGPEVSAVNPLLMLAAVLIAGFLAALFAVRAAMRQSILSGLRSE